MSYYYPLEDTWTTEEITIVVEFFSCIEKVYESGIDREVFLVAYRKFKEIVPSKSEEKGYFSSFEKASGYSGYHAVQKARKSADKEIRLSNRR